jgi:hypothetical protein
MKNTQKSLFVLLVVAVLVLTILACSSSATVVAPKNDAAQATSASASTDIPVLPDTSVPTPKPSTYKVGDLVEMGDINVTLNSVKVSGGVLTANVTITNISDKVISDFNPSSFDAKDSTSTPLESTYDCKQQLRGDLIPGDSLRGNLCWVDATGNTFKFIYTFYDEDYDMVIAVWEVTIE